MVFNSKKITIIGSLWLSILITKVIMYHLGISVYFESVGLPVYFQDLEYILPPTFYGFFQGVLCGK